MSVKYEILNLIQVAQFVNIEATEQLPDALGEYASNTNDQTKKAVDDLQQRINSATAVFSFCVSKDILNEQHTEIPQELEPHLALINETLG